MNRTELQTRPTCRTPSWLILLPLCAALVACGGGSDDEPPAPNRIAACFSLTAGTTYTYNDGERTLLVQEVFQGVSRPGLVSLVDNSGTTRGSAVYLSEVNGGVRVWGAVDYLEDVANTVTNTTLYSAGFTIPTQLQPGQSATLTFTETDIPDGGSPREKQREETWTFEGFETLTAAGRTFTDTCRFGLRRAGSQESSRFWLAPGFGFVRDQELDANGAVLSEQIIASIP